MKIRILNSEIVSQNLSNFKENPNYCKFATITNNRLEMN